MSIKLRDACREAAIALMLILDAERRTETGGIRMDEYQRARRKAQRALRQCRKALKETP